MARFDIGVVRQGTVGEEKRYLCIRDVVLEEGEEVLYIPGTFEGAIITHFGYREEHKEAEERWHDWHHPAQGMDYIPERYELDFVRIKTPKALKRVVFPKETTDINPYFFDRRDELVFEIDPENKEYGKNKEGKITKRYLLD